MRLKLICVFALLSACGQPMAVSEPGQVSQNLRTMSASQLCASYTSADTIPQVRLMIEAELAARGERQCFGRNIGGPSAAAFGREIYQRDSLQALTVSTSGRDVDCSDFATGAEAQRYFLAAGGPLNDPNDLDRDGDGLACEWGAQAKRLASYRPAPVRTSSPRCYTGPRGGTYTITASGRKNYSGC